jgi:hypothetical protein
MFHSFKRFITYMYVPILSCILISRREYQRFLSRIFVWRRPHASYELQKLPFRESLSDLPTSDPYDAVIAPSKHNVENILVRCGLMNAPPWRKCDSSDPCDADYWTRTLILLLWMIHDCGWLTVFLILVFWGNRALTSITDLSFITRDL